jgi:predicted nucleotide-binding protein
VARNGDSETPSADLAASRAAAEEIIDRHVNEAQSLLTDADAVTTDQDYNEWNRARERWISRTAAGLRAAFTTAEPAERFQTATRGTVSVGGQSLQHRFTRQRQLVDRGITRLLAIRDETEYMQEPQQAETPPDVPSPPSDATVFVVHGRDTEREVQVARLLEQAGDHAVTILHEQPHRGRTLLEKFEDHAVDSSYAIVLLTADDVGALAKRDERQPAEEWHYRARQNVVFELGFFAGALGRSKVAVLHDEGLQLPSDIQGLAYIPLDAGGAWQAKLLLELRAAGLQYDLNKLT